MTRHLLLAYLALGCVFVAAQHRRWWLEYERYIGRFRQSTSELSDGWRNTLIVMTTISSLSLDVVLWPHSLYVSWCERRFARFQAKLARELKTAEARMHGCPHFHRTLVDISDGSLPPAVKCRDCWAIQWDDKWVANCAPPPNVASDRDERHP